MAELFSGVGGWSEAAKMAGGITPIWCAEIHKYKNDVYQLRHPGVPNLGDVHNIKNAPYADIFTVSFPCTGISVAGKGQGLKDQGSGIWFEAERIIGESMPQYVAIENGPVLNKRGLARVLAGLARLGYDAEWTTLQGTQFDLQQRRRRIFIVAYSNKIRRQSEYPETTLFRKLTPRVRHDNNRFFPGWAERRDIPQPRTFRSANEFPALLHRLTSVGDAVIPLIGCYVLTCIKLHNQKFS